VSSPPWYFGTNLKMHQTPAETARFVGDLVAAAAAEPTTARTFVLPPFTPLSVATSRAAGSRLWIGAQNLHWAAEGPYTGEISPVMLQAVGVDLVLVGHAERRRDFGETDETVNRKVRAAFDYGLRVLLCVGETAEERRCRAGREACGRQLLMALHDVPKTAADRLLVAYEPVWAIGEGGTPATPEDVRPVVGLLRMWLRHLFQRDESAPILYGGSVDRENAAAFAAMPELDGLFVGRAAWTAGGFMQVLRMAEGARALMPNA
jgi:L-erythrulose 1-phosphate isomerase